MCAIDILTFIVGLPWYVPSLVAGYSDVRVDLGSLGASATTARRSDEVHAAGMSANAIQRVPVCDNLIED